MTRTIAIASLLLISTFAPLARAAEPATNNFTRADFLIAPLRIHLLSATNSPDAHTTLTEQDVTRILGKVNGIWAQAGIHFHLESLLREPAENTTDFRETVKTNNNALLRLRPEASKATNVLHVYYLKQFGPNGICMRGINFVKDTARLREVEGGIDEPIPRVTAHELGHALSLPHRQNVTNLLSSGTTGTWLNREEIDRTREAASKMPWIESASAILKRAEDMKREGKTAEAEKLLQRLAKIPLPPAGKL